MSAKLSQILEMLLNEQNDKAEELLHEYVVQRAREEYERVLDEDYDESDPTDDFQSDVEGMEDDEQEIDQDMDGQDDDFDDDMDDMVDDDDMEGEEEGDIEDKVSDLETELEELRAEFEKLLNGEDDQGEEEFDDQGDAEFGDDFDDQAGEEEDEYEVEVDDELDGLGEATNFSKTDSLQPMKGATLKGSEADNTKSPYTNAPKPSTVGKAGQPVKANDGGEGKKNHGGKPKDDTPSDNTMKTVKQKKNGSSYGAGMKKPESPKVKGPLPSNAK